MLMGVTLDSGIEIKEYFSRIKISGAGIKFPDRVPQTSQRLLTMLFKLNPSERVEVGQFLIPIELALNNLKGRSEPHRTSMHTITLPS